MRYAAEHKNEFRATGPVCQAEGRHQQMCGTVLSAFGAKCGEAVQEAVGEAVISECSLIFDWKGAT